MRTFKAFSLIIVFSIITSLVANAQFDGMKEKMDDVLLEVEQDIFTLRFFNALTGEPISGAQILIENAGEFETDSEGKVTFPRQNDGILKVLFKKSGFIASIFEVEVVVETIFFNRFSVSPLMNIEQFRVVLDWDKQPNDLDAHLVKGRDYHISYRNTRVLSDGSGMLDRDALNGYGPETITVARIDANGEYSFSVHNYSAHISSSSVPLSRSKATVRVYGNNRLLNTFVVPQNHNGNTWNVFKIVNGQVVGL